MSETSLTVHNKTFNELATYLPEHVPMLQRIQESLPEVVRATSFFGKTQSQFMDNMMTVSGVSPIRNARQCLAEITRMRAALREAHFKNEKKRIEIKTKELELKKYSNKTFFGLSTLSEAEVLKVQLLETEIAEIKSELSEGEIYISGAIRRIDNYVSQYKTILKSAGKEEFTEKDFEEDEEHHHITTAFSQAITAARSRKSMGYTIDEGNHIYFYQIGINGAIAETEVRGLLMLEEKRIQEAVANAAYNAKEPNAAKHKPVEFPDHTMILEFLNTMANKYSGSARKFAEAKGMTVSTEHSLIHEGDKRLMLQGGNK